MIQAQFKRSSLRSHHSTRITNTTLTPPQYSKYRRAPSSTFVNSFRMVSSFYDLVPKDSKNKDFPFSQLKGKAVLIVNVASQCGFTKQYDALQALYDKYKERGFEIIAFPCNQFGGQEPGTDAEIEQFCTLNFGVTFPIMKKIEVNGADADPVYQFSKSKKSGLLGFSGIKWNFEKFLVDRQGNVTNRWASTTSPKALETIIERTLDEKPSEGN